jgi:hypothetical protein
MTVQVEIHRHQADLAAIDAIEQRTIGVDEATDDWALARATTDPAAAIKAAIEFFGDGMDP